MKTPSEMARAASTARGILTMQTAAYLMGIVEESENADDVFMTIVEECSYLLIEKCLEEKWEPMYYEMVRNELTILLNKLFYA